MRQRAILVVDDDPFIRKVITKLLETAGHEPVAVGDSQKALEVFATHSFDLVLTDYDMPVMTGFELARRMRTLKASVPICLVSGSSGSVDADEFESFDGVLTKPFNAEELKGLLAATLPEDERAAGLVSRPPRYSVDWRVECLPLAAVTLARSEWERQPVRLRNVSEHGLAFVADETFPAERFCAFLIQPPGSESPALMVGEVRWTRERDGGTLSGTRSMFWGSEREKESVIEQAM